MAESPFIVRALKVAVVAMTLVFAASRILPFGHSLPFWGAAVLNIGVFAMATVLVALRAVLAPKQRLAWALLACGLGCYTSATTYSFVVTRGVTALAFPSVADAGWLLLYPFAYTAIIMLIRGRVQHSRTRMFLDGAIAGLGGAAVFSALVIGFLIKPSNTGILSTMVAVAYPAGDALLIGTLVCLFTISGWRRGHHLGVLTASMVAFAVADTGYVALASHGAYRPGGAVDVLYLIALMLVGLAAWQKERRPAAATPDGRGSALLALPTIFALASLGLLLLATAVPVSPVPVALAGITLLAIVVRTLVSFSELREAQAQLVDAARQAGMAEIATNVLHNVGNVLNSVNVSANLVGQKVRGSKSPGLARAAALMREHAGDLGEFVTTDARGKELPGYLDTLAATLAAERESIDEELLRLTEGVAHIKQIVSAQQSLAGFSGVVEQVKISDLVEDALRMAGVLGHVGITLVRDFPGAGVLSVDRHRVLLVLLNLISNAKHAIERDIDRPHQLSVGVEVVSGQAVRITVADNGEGIAPENLTRIFVHGFTTHAGGHGFGLHSSALAAKEMGGALTVRSDGLGSGAAFTLDVPLQRQVVLV